MTNRDSFSTLCSVLVAALVAAWSIAVAAQGPTYNIGRTPTQQELRFADAAIRPEGQGLPPGSGTAEQGAVFSASGGVRDATGQRAPKVPLRSRWPVVNLVRLAAAPGRTP